MVELDVPTSLSPYTKLTILRVRDPGEMVSAGIVLGLFGFFFVGASSVSSLGHSKGNSQFHDVQILHICYTVVVSLLLVHEQL
uniref:Uncharacterized protein n=1 Tax=Arundo donax TaxID=35708 RepID=A0A0A8ZUK9_ARUDO